MPDTEDERRREADRQLAAVIYFMTCHARSGCPRLASLIQRHLELIGRNPESGAHVQETCRRLAAGWSCVRAYDEERLESRDSPDPAARLH